MSPNLRFYARLLLRRLPAMLFLVVSITVGGLFFAAELPTTYVSQTRLLVQSQSISEELAASTVQISGLEEVQLLREQVLTRTNLIEIATSLNVFDGLNQMTPDQIYTEMTRATRVLTQGGDGNRRSAGSPVVLVLGFEAREGQIAADVLNEYVTRILAASVRLRTGQAGATLSFFEQEVARLTDELELRSSRITEFQRENAGALPDDQDFRLQRQSMLQERLAAAERDRRSLAQERELTINAFASGVTPANTALPPDQQALQQLQNELADNLQIFSESAPQVQTLQRRIAALEERIQQQAGTAQAGDDPEIEEITDPFLILRLAEIDSQTRTLDVTLQETADELEELRDAIARAPLNAIQLQRLERDYENVQLQFENARRALAQASVGERLEIGGRGQQIILLEPPVVPSRPASPNRPLIAAGAAGAGIVLALGFFVLLELLNRSVRRPVELVKALGVMPFAVLPLIETADDRFRRRSAVLAKVLFVVTGIPAALLWAINEYYMPLDQLSDRILNSLGLA